MPLITNTHISFLCTLNFGIQWCGYVVSMLLATEKFFDITGSIAFISLVYISYENSVQSVRQIVHAGAVVTWATRLGLYLLIRILRRGGDRRFNIIKENPVLFFYTWTLQGVWVIVTLYPTLLLLSKKDDYEMGDRDFIGYGLWLIGFFIEVIADYQKTVFRNNPFNQGRFIRSGLWSLSRHPNYFGEILLWFGLYLSASSTFTGKEALSVLCPIFNLLLITKISGIPPLEKYGLIKWGTDAGYIAYLRKTPVLVPFIW